MRLAWRAVRGIELSNALDGIDWTRCKRDLAADKFDNGRSPEALRRSFEHSDHVVIAWYDDQVIGMARLLSDGVCNAYLLDVWTHSAYRRQGVGRAMVQRLSDAVPGQHIGLQTDDQQPFYETLGFRPQPEFLSKVVGRWLENDGNR